MITHGGFASFKKQNCEHMADYILTEEVAEDPKSGLLYRQRGVHSGRGRGCQYLAMWLPAAELETMVLGL